MRTFVKVWAVNYFHKKIHHYLNIFRIRSFSGPYFLAFKLNAERYCSVFSLNAGNTYTFHAVHQRYLTSSKIHLWCLLNFNVFYKWSLERTPSLFVFCLFVCFFVDLKLIFILVTIEMNERKKHLTLVSYIHQFFRKHNNFQILDIIVTFTAYVPIKSCIF